MPATIRRSFVARSLGLLLVAGCASAPAAGGAAGRGPLDVITRAELAEPSLTGTTVLEAIRRLRPRFLNERGAGLHGEMETAQVSINGSQPGALAELSRIDVADVQEIRYLSTADAGLRFGLKGSMAPVLLVTLRH
jgi:hypothetical protein